MARKNATAKAVEVFTHEGAEAYPHLKPLQILRRSLAACLLWEDQFYEDGESVADRIVKTAKLCRPEDVAALAIEARSQMNLRHVPLLLLHVLMDMTRGKLISQTIAKTIQRADELAELMAIRCELTKKTPKKALTHQMRKGLALAFQNFNAYDLAKYNQDRAVKLRDVLFLLHAKPANDEQAAVLQKLVDKTLAPADTWEVALSAGADKKETFERLLRDEQLGYLALLRNLRNMEQAGVDRKLIETALRARKGARRVLPFRYIAAAKAAPKLEPVINDAMLASLAQAPKLTGKTVVVVDVSGSMGCSLSRKSDLDRAHAASAVAAVLRETCEEVVVYATAGSDGARKHKTALVPARRGIALVDAIWAMSGPLGGGGIFLNQVMNFVNDQEKAYDRVVVLTDEQDCSADAKDAPQHAKPLGKHNYLINVGAYKNGIGYDKWVHIDGFSESTVRFIHEHERA